MSYRYLPEPTKSWYRVQRPCTFETSPTTNKSLLQKGNVLQYKKNSSCLTKNQRYSQIAKGFGSNRTKVWATQSEVYTNPNTRSLQRVNFVTVPTTNVEPFFCKNVTTIQEGGSLVCGVTVNPCTQEIVKTSKTTYFYPNTDSDVPGKPTMLYWDSKIQPWNPRQRYTMSSSLDKFPTGYKGLVSALTPVAPKLYFLVEEETNTATLVWTCESNACIPITEFSIFQNNVLLATVESTVFSFLLQKNTPGTYQYGVTAVSNQTSSPLSNTLNYTVS